MDLSPPEPKKWGYMGEAYKKMILTLKFPKLHGFLSELIQSLTSTVTCHYIVILDSISKSWDVI